MEDNASTLLSFVKYYINKGILIVPLQPRSKYNFIIKRFKKPIKTMLEAEYIWGICSNANISAPTGKKYNDWIVLDIDVKNGINGVESIKAIMKERGLVLPDTAVSKSGSGGFHCYYRNIKNTTVTSSNGKRLGIDIRAENAYIVLPPSVHFSGTRYSWFIGNIDSIANANDDVYKLVDIVNKLNGKQK